MCGTKFLSTFFGGEKSRLVNEGLRCVGLNLPPRAGGGVWNFGFHNNKQKNKTSIGYPLSVFNIKLYSQTKCHTDTGKKIMYVSICVCVYAFVGMCLCVWTSAPACALCACTRQRKQQQERTAHTLQVTALEFISHSRQQERAYHPNNHTRVQTQGLSQSSSVLLPPHDCVLNWLIPIKNGWGFNSWILWNFFAGNFEFCSQRSFFFRKTSPYVACYERWGGLVGWLGLWATFQHVCHSKKITVPLAQKSEKGLGLPIYEIKPFI